MTREEFEDFTACKLGICGCADREDVLQQLADVLACCHTDYPGGERQMDAVMKCLDTTREATYYAYMSWLDRAELVEHGVAIRWCWLTGDGEAVKAAIPEFIEEADNE